MLKEELFKLIIDSEDELFMSSTNVLSVILKGLANNASQALKKHGREFDEYEKRARCLFFIAQSVGQDSLHKWGTLETLLTEVFMDLSQSIYTAAQSQYRTSYQALRSALELTLATVYFADHPVEFHQWKLDKYDFQFSSGKSVLTIDYAEALGVVSFPKQSRVTNLYRELSQYVHGKYNYLSVNLDSVLQYDEEQLGKLFGTFDETFQVILLLCIYRFKAHVDAASGKYPYLKACLEVLS